MSSIYILEPPTSGKVLLKTSVGDIDVELWTKEAPLACRNFIQLCLEGYYNNTIFHRVVKGFIVQGGDPDGSGMGGESIYDAPFKDEFHQRLKFSRRGLLAMANAGKNDNGSQFFFTMAATMELQDKHTIFGKVVGDTLFNMLKLEEGLVEDERPVYPHKIIKTEVLNNPFGDIIPRITKGKEQEVKPRKRKKEKGVKDFKLLSFGDEAEEDEQESMKESNIFAKKGKSTHDLLDDPKLSSQAVDIDATPSSSKHMERSSICYAEKTDSLDDSNYVKGDLDNAEAPNEQTSYDDLTIENKVETVRQRLMQRHAKIVKRQRDEQEESISNEHSSVQDELVLFHKEENDKLRNEQFRKIQDEIKNVKKEYNKNRLPKKKQTLNSELDADGKSDNTDQDSINADADNAVGNEYALVHDKYKAKMAAIPKKGLTREQLTQNLLDKFSKKVKSLRELSSDGSQEKSEEPATSEESASTIGDSEWLTHGLRCQKDAPVLAKDANKMGADWFEIYDPRNVLNKRRRGEIDTKQ